jgi:hypothetical protein
MNISISIDFPQLKSIIQQCDLQEKLELLNLLERDTFAVRFNNVLNKLKTNELDLDTITAEVEAVRQGRYSEQ